MPHYVNHTELCMQPPEIQAKCKQLADAHHTPTPIAWDKVQKLAEALGWTAEQALDRDLKAAGL
ncbi:MAG: hypothetical protein HY398_00365 [Candidatus Doudnabacteria bacterium]|nr:hypothetical protein [Candidatus Doudnabacteria bacterium]